MDIGASVLDWAGVTPEVPMQAQSLRPATTDANWNGRDYVIAEHGRDMFLHDIEKVMMLRTARWKWVSFDDSTCGQLFDLRNDPEEYHNLWDDPAHVAIKTALKAAAKAARSNENHQASALLP
jgi:arylsulfatase A-like enzyme